MANMDDVEDDDFLVLNMDAVGEYLKRKKPGWGPTICLALLLREKKLTWGEYKEAHDKEWEQIEELREKNSGSRLPGVHQERDGFIGGFRRKGIVYVPGKPYRPTTR